ncbi:MAG: hypothetical protein ACI9SQ_001190 [Rubritalea sp.]|jgi:hypothetical protein
MRLFYPLMIKISLVVTVFAFASCASEKTVMQSKVRSGLDQYNNGYDIEKGEHGMLRSASDKVSHYDRRASNIGARDFSGKNYNKESYRKERWGGNKGYASKQYGGNTDGSKFKHSPHYVSRDTRAQANGQYANADKSRFNTGKYTVANNRANESRSNAVKTGASGYVTSRNKRPQPLIMSKDDYNELGVSDTNQMLGR